MATDSPPDMEPGQDTDIALMLRLAGGEDLALNELISRWRSRVASFLLRMVGEALEGDHGADHAKHDHRNLGRDAAEDAPPRLHFVRERGRRRHL